MLRVRTALTGWDGGPGLMTSYFLTPLQDADAALRCVGYVHSQIAVAAKWLMPTGVTLQVSGDVDVIEAASGAVTDTLSVAVPTSLSGDAGSGFAPTASAALLRLNTSTFIAGRRVRGRVFISPLGSSVIAANGGLTIVGAGVPAGVFDAVAADLDSGDTWVVWHRPIGGSGGSAVPITATSCPVKVAVLTSRRD